MTDIPPAAIAAAAAAIGKLPNPPTRFEGDRWRSVSRIALDAAAPLIADAERARIAQVIDPAKLELLADWFDADDALKGADPSWPSPPRTNDEVQRDLRRWAALLRGDHFATFTGPRYWSVEHPPSCNDPLEPPVCEYLLAVERVAGNGAPAEGRWRITGLSEGLPDLERVES